uniref:Uncharacterized protein n=1 Tax=Heterorhabditis bacteriophora TaxID=37862 RepID=A0A1I7X9V7_HETBA
MQGIVLRTKNCYAHVTPASAKLVVPIDPHLHNTTNCNYTKIFIKFRYIRALARSGGGGLEPSGLLRIEIELCTAL